jgi:hypothetical protein
VLSPLLERLEQDRLLDDPARLRERLDALDRLELCLLDGDHHRRAEAIRVRLEAVNDTLYRRLRDAIRQGAGADALSPWMREQAGDSEEDSLPADGYDYLMSWSAASCSSSRPMMRASSSHRRWCSTSRHRHGMFST